jgi:two-component sensor histidine kinase
MLQALANLSKALALYQSINYPQLQGVYDLLGYIHLRLGDYQEGLRYGLLAVKTAEQLGDSTMQLCTIYNRVGVTYFDLRRYKESSDYSKKSLRIAQKYNDRPSIIVITAGLVTTLVQLYQPEEALTLLSNTYSKYTPQNTTEHILYSSRFLHVYTALKQYRKGQAYCDQLLSLSKKLNKNDGLLNDVYLNSISFLLASGQYGQARTYLAKAEQFLKENGFLRRYSTIQLMWFRLDSIQGDYPSAIKHYQRYKQLQDSLLSEAKNQRIASLEVIYETEKKEQDLQLKEESIKALTREKQLQAKQSEQDRLIRNVLVGGAVMLLSLVGVLYNRYRLKQRSNQQLKAQQKQLQTQHEELQAQQEVLQAQQREIQHKNEHLSELLLEKDSLLHEKDALIGEKVSLLLDKDQFAARQQQLLAEKERLLREIHHRVKNNLQVVMSLLSSQAASLQDQAALSAIQESQHRVQAMALIHQKLYQNEGVARIEMRSYLQEIVAYLSDCYCLSGEIRFYLEAQEIDLDVTQAVPLGLIINEALTNALKYAFPGGRAGRIELTLEQPKEQTYQLTIADDGVGLPTGFDASQSRSLGMTLLHGFSDQLDGELTLSGPPGLSIQLTFREQLSPLHTHVSPAATHYN